MFLRLIIEAMRVCVYIQALSKITSTGAMTFCFIQAIERSPQGTTYGNILNSMRTTIRNTGSGGGISVGGGGGGVVTSVLSMLLTGGSGMGGLRQVQFLVSRTFFFFVDDIDW